MTEELAVLVTAGAILSFLLGALFGVYRADRAWTKADTRRVTLSMASAKLPEVVYVSFKAKTIKELMGIVKKLNPNLGTRWNHYEDKWVPCEAQVDGISMRYEGDKFLHFSYEHTEPKQTLDMVQRDVDYDNLREYLLRDEGS